MNDQEWQSWLREKEGRWGASWDPSDLAPQFIPYFRTDRRIGVLMNRMKMGVIRGRVGVTTGWRPAFILLRTKRSMDSPWVLSAEDEVQYEVPPRRIRR